MKGCIDPKQAKYACFYCEYPTSQAPVRVSWVNGSDKIYPSCCTTCMQMNRWRSLPEARVPEHVVAQANALTFCPLAKTTDHPCSSRAALVQWAYDVIAEKRGMKKEDGAA